METLTLRLVDRFLAATHVIGLGASPSLEIVMYFSRLTGWFTHFPPRLWLRNDLILDKY